MTRQTAQIMVRSDCIEWSGSLNIRNGYGQKRVGGRVCHVHRLEWERVRGAIPSGMKVLHSCDNPACYNIEHLFLGTQLDNMRDCRAKGRNARGDGHGRSKLTAAKVLQARRLAAKGATPRELAIYFGVTPSTISRALARRTWSHVQ